MDRLVNQSADGHLREAYKRREVGLHHQVLGGQRLLGGSIGPLVDIFFFGTVAMFRRAADRFHKVELYNGNPHCCATGCSDGAVRVPRGVVKCPEWRGETQLSSCNLTILRMGNLSNSRVAMAFYGVISLIATRKLQAGACGSPRNPPRTNVFLANQLWDWPGVGT